MCRWGVRVLCVLVFLFLWGACFVCGLFVCVLLCCFVLLVFGMRVAVVVGVVCLLCLIVCVCL